MCQLSITASANQTAQPSPWGGGCELLSMPMMSSRKSVSLGQIYGDHQTVSLCVTPPHISPSTGPPRLEYINLDLINQSIHQFNHFRTEHALSEPTLQCTLIELLLLKYQITTLTSLNYELIISQID